MPPRTVTKLINFADAALATAETTSQQVIDLAGAVREAANEIGQWLHEHENAFAANVTRLTGTAPAPLTPPAPPVPDTADAASSAADTSAAPAPASSDASPPTPSNAS